MTKKKSPAPVKLAVGQVWRCRNGDKATIARRGDGPVWPWRGNLSTYPSHPVGYWSWDDAGRFGAKCQECPLDLVRLISRPKKRNPAPKPKPARKGKCK